MSVQTVEQHTFGFFGSLPVVVEARAVQLSSDGGLLAVRAFDDQIDYTRHFVACLNDARDPDALRHSLREMVSQRLFGAIAGYEDCNDHDGLRSDPIFKLISGQPPEGRDLASQPTLSRFENAVDIPSLWRLHEFFIDAFIRSFDTPPTSITLDIDAWDDPCHGDQQLALFHGFYDQYQYLPIAISCAQTQDLLYVALRPGNMHAALGADDDLEFVVTRLRRAWPDVQIHVRGDAGCGVPWMYHVCERLEVFYTFGLSANAALKRWTDVLVDAACYQFEQTGQPQRCFDEFWYRAGTWADHRRVIVKAEYNPQGSNRRFVVTNRPIGPLGPAVLYDEYAERGESENRNKELKRGICADRLSCGRFVANYFRLQLYAAALNLVNRLRRLCADPPPLTEFVLNPGAAVPVHDPALPVAALAGRERRRYHNYRRRLDPLGEGHLETWRRMFLKVAAEVQQSARRILVIIPSHWPYLDWCVRIWRKLARLGGAPRAVT